MTEIKIHGASPPVKKKCSKPGNVTYQVQISYYFASLPFFNFHRNFVARIVGCHNVEEAKYFLVATGCTNGAAAAPWELLGLPLLMKGQ